VPHPPVACDHEVVAGRVDVGADDVEPLAAPEPRVLEQLGEEQVLHELLAVAGERRGAQDGERIGQGRARIGGAGHDRQHR
jgi:hypothetical protein